MRIQNASSKPSDASNGGHKDEENPRETEKAYPTNNGSHIDKELCDEPESEPVILNGDHQDEEIPHGVIAASGSQQQRNGQEVDGRLIATETCQVKEPLMRSSEASRNNHRDVETHQKTEPASKPQKLRNSVEGDERLTIMEWTKIAHFYMFGGVVFCGIYVAAYVLLYPFTFFSILDKADN